MKIGISASSFDLKFGPIVFRGTDIKKTFEQIAEYGYDGVDLFIHNLSDTEIGTLDQAAKEYGLDVAMLAAIWVAEDGGSLTDPDAAARRETVRKLKDHLQLAGRFGAAVPIGFLRGRLNGREMADYRAILAESLSELEEVAVSSGATIVLEAVNRYEIDSFLRVGETRDFLEEFHLEDTQILADLFHMNIEERDIHEAILYGGSRIGHFHCPDSNRLAPGEGQFDYEALISTLKETGYDGYLSIESPPEPSAEECARAGITHLRAVLDRIDQDTAK